MKAHVNARCNAGRRNNASFVDPSHVLFDRNVRKLRAEVGNVLPVGRCRFAFQQTRFGQKKSTRAHGSRDFGLLRGVANPLQNFSVSHLGIDNAAGNQQEVWYWAGSEAEVRQYPKAGSGRDS